MKSAPFLLCLAACSENALQPTEVAYEAGNDSAETTVVDTAAPMDTAPEDTVPPAILESCMEILLAGQSVGDGVYEINPPCGEPRDVVCDMTTDGGGWTGTTQLDFSVDACPGDWQTTEKHDLCSRQSTSDTENIRAASLSGWCIEYQDVRGALTAYQYQSTDAFGDGPPDDIDQAYMDGISLTVSLNGQTHHLFSHSIGYRLTGEDDSNCPGVEGGAQPHNFVGTDHRCDTGNQSGDGPSAVWFVEQPLFEGEFFQVSLPQSSAAPIDARLMATHTNSDEDVGVGKLELWIR